MSNRSIAHIEPVHRQKKFTVRRLNILEHSIFPLTSLFISKHECHLNIEPFRSLIADEIDFALFQPSNADVISATHELEIYNILEKLINITSKTSPHNRVADSCISNIKLLVHRKNSLSNKILSRHPCNQKSLLAGSEIVQDSLNRGLSPFPLKKIDNASSRKSVSTFCHDEANDTIKQIDITNLFSSNNILEKNCTI